MSADGDANQAGDALVHRSRAVIAGNDAIDVERRQTRNLQHAPWIITGARHANSSQWPSTTEGQQVSDKRILGTALDSLAMDLGEMTKRDVDTGDTRGGLSRRRPVQATGDFVRSEMPIDREPATVVEDGKGPAGSLRIWNGTPIGRFEHEYVAGIVDCIGETIGAILGSEA
jgi:hypothetical protein